ncbi:MAG: ATP-binding cassette domain-containing protein [Candidatus Saccharimonadales bacterium]
MADKQIVLDKLSKRYPGTQVYSLRDVSFSVEAGEVYGFLGANGAGKSTAIRTLLNFIQPSGGGATIMGLDVVKDSVAIKRHVGYLSGEVALYGRMTGGQFLKYMAALQPLKKAKYQRELARRFDADLDKPIGNLSKGQRQKIGLLQAFMHEPEMLILDEPTSGLDPLMQEEFFKLIRESKARGTAVFASSHNFAEVQRMCDKVGFIREGKLVAEQTLADLAAQAAHTFTLAFADQAPRAELAKLSGAKVTAHDEHHLTVSFQGELTPLFALGDMASFTNKNGEILPALAQVAVKQSSCIAQNIVKSINQKPLSQFDYQPIAFLISLGRGQGVGQIFGSNLSGWPVKLLVNLAYLKAFPTFKMKRKILAVWARSIFSA